MSCGGSSILRSPCYNRVHPCSRLPGHAPEWPRFARLRAWLLERDRASRWRWVVRQARPVDLETCANAWAGLPVIGSARGRPRCMQDRAARTWTLLQPGRSGPPHSTRTGPTHASNWLRYTGPALILARNAVCWSGIRPPWVTLDQYCCTDVKIRVHLARHGRPQPTGHQTDAAGQAASARPRGARAPGPRRSLCKPVPPAGCAPRSPSHPPGVGNLVAGRRFVVPVRHASFCVPATEPQLRGLAPGLRRFFRGQERRSLRTRPLWATQARDFNEVPKPSPPNLRPLSRW